MFSLCILFGTLLSAVDWAAFSRPFYAKSYRALNTAAEIGITQSDLDAATEQLLAYIQGNAPQLDIEVSLSNTAEYQKTRMFNQREIEHIEDVKNLYLSAMLVRNVLFVLAFVFLLCLIVLMRKKHTKQDFKYLRQALFMALSVFSLLLVLLTTYAALDFEGFWTRFHLLFFSNDLWILNPLTDRLIMMVPSAFFSALVKKIILTACTALIFYNILAFALSHFFEKQLRQANEAKL